MAHILVVGAHLEDQQLITKVARDLGYTVCLADSIRNARIEAGRRQPDLAFVQLNLPDGSGLSLFEDFPAQRGTRLVLLAPDPSLDSAVCALRLGAHDYLSPPLEMASLKQILSSLPERLGPRQETSALHPSGAPSRVQSDALAAMIGRSPAMRTLAKQIDRVAHSSVSVLLIGETGTGKELAARAIHQMSPRARQAFLPLNCGAMSAHLIESELFGHERGSFTGADRQHKGFFEQAHGGTVFLDEVTEMPADLQVKLLRVLETGTFSRVGSVTPIHSDVRVISATNRIPEQAVQSGRLREDLYHRLNVFPIRLPALRERPADIEVLAQHFLLQLNHAEGSSKQFDPRLLASWQLARWPGNVRELKNAVHRAFILCDAVLGDDSGAAPAESNSGGLCETGSFDEPGPPEQPVISIRLGTPLQSVEKTLTLATLIHCKWDRRRAAELLGMSAKTLTQRIESLELQRNCAPHRAIHPRAAAPAVHKSREQAQGTLRAGNFS